MPRMISPNGLERNLPSQAVKVHLSQGWELVDDDAPAAEEMPDLGPEPTPEEPEEA